MWSVTVWHISAGARGQLQYTDNFSLVSAFCVLFSPLNSDSDKLLAYVPLRSGQKITNFRLFKISNSSFFVVTSADGQWRSR